MIFIHNSLSKESRAFIAAHATPQDTVYDWYDGGREAFWATGNTHEVSAFPSIVIDIPSHRIPANSDHPVQNIPRKQKMVRKPADMAAVQAHLDRINVVLARSPRDPRRPIEPLTLDNMSDRKR